MYQLSTVKKFLYILTIILFLMIPIFDSNSAHFDWGFTLLMLVVLPLIVVMPMLLTYDIYSLYKKRWRSNLNIKLLLFIAFLSWVWACSHYVF